MVKKQNPNLLCKLGLHKWRNYGESVMVTWLEPQDWRMSRLEGGVLIRRPKHTRGREVFTKRKCLRCGTNVKRILVKNADGTLSCVGWEPLSQSEYEKSSISSKMN